ncbi:D-alanyl-D-alanine carboxypeptidase/D-alanyl-D-alanine-endopeptidase (penicillin-binding protein 4) [Streptomyces phaeochromogenes]|uniref:D-alanyl-D-alanine carboxypeptidase/D-alanyl-D-alanine endopeptidase n=1 Tax=Streptomyces phaeochromogenes TaxID=1923 RepID=UPI00278E51F2|nr:D-alanyl-D-alanine carboxypeptidase/D-alanyl-D-alanine-endopeptidase [Streptomyces phaeochromogenes]MDQ0951601.1 D-alanyl-D-alanine carboxypeptidase/D-alanyl-D-alanine-endopeptidase (penicillin-binding protein 4) [Streptomyces phaeochromogenes]
MVVPELKAWRAARPHVVRVARSVRPQLVRAVGAVKPPLVRAAGAVKPLVTQPSTVQFTAGAATLGLVVAATVVTAAGPWDSTGQRTAERDWAASQGRAGGADHGHVSGTSGKAPAPAPSAASVLTGLGGSVGAGPSPTEKALADVLGPLLGDPALGSERAAAVVDLATGKRLYGKGADDALTPASTTKIATAVAALTAAGADHRIATRTVLEAGASGKQEVVLVGGGDPTLTARKDAEGNASLRTLADDTARALKDRKTDEVTLSYDTSLYEGPDVHPIGLDNTNVARVTALMADEGRLDDSSSGTAKRSEDPAADAAKKFADLLKDRGIKTTVPGPSKATDRAKALATVKSPPLSALVERMLTSSDNDIAEALARQAAVAADEPASFKGGGTAIRKQLKQLGLPLKGAEFADGSGLDRADKLTADLLTALLAKAADPAHPELRAALTGLPVAGFTGTLSTRYAGQPGTGLVRAKTGTLTGVHTLAGTVVDTDGHLLAFAFLTASDPPTEPTATQKGLDALASTLATCGCN